MDVVEYPDDHEGETPKPDAVAFHKATEAVRSWHTEPAVGMEIHKFCTRDDWLVTPAEISAGLAAYRGHSETEIVPVLRASRVDDRERWDRWIAFLGRAEQQGGFRVD